MPQNIIRLQQQGYHMTVESTAAFIGGQQALNAGGAHSLNSRNPPAEVSMDATKWTRINAMQLATYLRVNVSVKMRQSLAHRRRCSPSVKHAMYSLWIFINAKCTYKAHTVLNTLLTPYRCNESLEKCSRIVAIRKRTMVSFHTASKIHQSPRNARRPIVFRCKQ